MLKKLTKKDALYAGTVFFIVYLAYLLTVYPTVATEDSGEFAAVIHTFGIAHPSGYPIYVILGKIFTLLVPFGGKAWQVNIFSAFCGAATVAGLYVVMKMLTGNRALSVAVSLFFGSGSIFWAQSIRAEVYTLNSLFLITVLILGLTYYQYKEGSILLWLALLFGLSIGNHHLMLMTGPPLALLIILAKPKVLLDFRLIGKALLLFLLGLSIYLYLPIRASYEPEINWGNPNNSERFWDHVQRYSYSIDALDPSLNPIQYQSQATESNLIIDFFQFHIAEFSVQYMGVMAQNYTWIPVILALIGLYFAFRKEKKLGWFFVILILFHSFILSHFIGLGIPDKLPVQYFTARPFYLPLLLITVILAGYGIHCTLKKLPKKFKKIASGMLIAIAVLTLVLQFPVQDQSRNYIAYDIAKAALTSLPEDAVLLSENNDNTLFPLLYLQKVEKIRPDVTIYIRSPINIYRFFTDYETMVAENPGKPIFTDFPFIHYTDKTYDYGGTFSQVVPLTQSARFGKPTIEEGKVRGLENKNLDHFHTYLRARYYLDSGLTYGHDKQKQEAFFQKALNSAPESTNIVAQLIGNYYVRQFQFAEAIPYLEKAHEWMPNEYPISFQLALSYITQNQLKEATNFIESHEKETKELLLKELGILQQIDPNSYPHLSEFFQ